MLNKTFRIALVILLASVIGILWAQVLPIPFSILASVISGAFIGYYGYDYTNQKS